MRAPVVPVLLAAGCLVGRVTAAEGQYSDGHAQSGQMIAAAFRLMDAAYPEGRESGKLEIRGRTFSGRRLREFGLQLTTGELRELRTSEQMTVAPCYGAFVCGHTDARLVSYFGHGRCVKEAENATLRADFLLKLWTDEQLGGELARRGARFGPGRKQEFLDSIPGIDVFESIAGEQLILRDVIFQLPIRAEGKVDPGGYALRWKVTFEVVSMGGVTFVALFEPFDGRLTSLHRFPRE